MWFLEEREKPARPKKPGILLTVGVEHVIGRKDCTILIQDDASISRKHSIITVNHDEFNLGDLNKMSQVVIQDFSTYGTFVNGVKISGSISLKTGDEILFGKNNSYYKLRCSRLVVTTSCLEEKKKKPLKSLVHKFGGHILGDWQPNITSHLVMDGLTFTRKVIHALAECCPIVTPSYFVDIANSTSQSTALERVHSYLPPLKEETISSMSKGFLPNEARRTLFKGKTFIFISKKQFKQYHAAVESSGGVASLKDAPGSESDSGLVSKDVCVMMMDNKEQKSLPAESLQWVLHVTETLKRHKCRPIPESELGLALLFTSVEKYCNPSIYTAVPALTQNLVSQSFQTVDTMSQQIVDHETQKPTTPVKATKAARIQETSSQKPPWTSCMTDQKSTLCMADQKSTKTTLLGKRCNNGESGFESVPESQMDNQRKAPLTKRRRLETAEKSACSETPIFSESLIANKTHDGSQGNIQLALAESNVADSLQVEQSDVFERNENDISHGMTTKVEKVSDSLDASTDCCMRDCLEDATVETFKTIKKEIQVKSIARQSEEESRNKENGLTDNQRDKQDERMQEFKVPVGFLCSRMPRKGAQDIKFEDESAHLPGNLVLVDHVSLVVQPSVSVTPAARYVQGNTKPVKNTKTFRKQLYPGSRTSLPRIIGGSDLTVYQSYERLEKDDWFQEAKQADAERQREERMAEELFRWEGRPTKSRRTNR
ncbi:nibrin-like [Acropora muricata]|uniref:nibrin-like n=1 Tax=Acropora muricata TaxID=159855 RepID=UPI0034E52E09